MKKRSKKIKAEHISAIFPRLFLNRMKLALLKQHSVFYGITFRKMDAEPTERSSWTLKQHESIKVQGRFTTHNHNAVMITSATHCTIPSLTLKVASGFLRSVETHP